MNRGSIKEREGKLWSLVIVVFAFAFVMSEGIAYFERRVEFYAGNR